MFIPAIGIDDLIIPNLELRAAILSTLEAASVLELLLRAEALTAAGRVALYAASRRFLETLKVPPSWTSRRRPGRSPSSTC